MSKGKLLIIGAGGRGNRYADETKRLSDKAAVVGVADPQEYYRTRMAQAHSIASENIFQDWREAAARERFADAVVICTHENMHLEPAVAFARKGYHVLLEKPMAPDEKSCEEIVKAVEDAGVIFAVCHVLLYTKYTRTLKQIIDEGRIGEVVNLQHLEPVRYWQYAHGFVRGKWRNEQNTSPMLLAKSCHDLDWIRHVMGRPCRQVQSFGNLIHFRKSEQPAGAAERCLECAIEKSCPYSAKKIYLDDMLIKKGRTDWPVNCLTPEPNVESVTEALRHGPYGRCVYACDNSVVDQQIVNLLFEGGASASFTMIGFAADDGSGGRKTRIFGTKGMIEGDSSVIKVCEFLTDKEEIIDTNASDGSMAGGHGGGDGKLMDAFVEAIATNDPSALLSGSDVTLDSHRMVFAAERSRKTGQVISIN